MDAARDEFAARGCSVLAVVQAKPESLAHYLARRSYGVPLVSDPERVAYRAFGLERTRWRTFFKPRVLLGFLKLMVRGNRVRVPYADEDVLQMGGDFILNRRGEVVFAYRSADPTDRPSLAALLATLPSPVPMGENPASDARRVDSPPGGG